MSPLTKFNMPRHIEFLRRACRLFSSFFKKFISEKGTIVQAGGIRFPLGTGFLKLKEQRFQNLSTPGGLLAKVGESQSHFRTRGRHLPEAIKRIFAAIEKEAWSMSAGMKLIKMIPTSHTAEMRTKGRSSGGLMDASHTDITTINLRQIKM